MDTAAHSGSDQSSVVPTDFRGGGPDRPGSPGHVHGTGARPQGEARPVERSHSHCHLREVSIPALGPLIIRGAAPQPRLADRPPGSRESQKWEPTQSAASRLSATHSECSSTSRTPGSTQLDGDRHTKPP